MTQTPDGNVSSRFVFGAAIFLAAFLLFQIEFIIGKFLLPWFGGVSGVWATAMLCFQVALLAGYAYGHWLQRRADQARVHLWVLGAVALFVVVRFVWGGPLPGDTAKPEPDANPILGIIRLFATTIGPQFFLLASTAPLLQAWYAEVHKREPYTLYALSNAGSLLALASYPLFFERILGMRFQARLWTGMLLFYFLCVLACALRVRKQGTRGRAGRAQATASWRMRAMWLFLSACPSALFLAVTNYLTQDVAPIPMLWALPLGIYLLSFILTFGWPNVYLRGLWHAAIVVTSLFAFTALFVGTDLAVGPQLAAFCAWLFVCCMICHGELVKLLPPKEGLTDFYLTIAVGGALGGFFVAIVAPLAFKGLWELHVAAVATFLAAMLALWQDRGSWLYAPQAWLPPALLGVVFLVPAVLGWFALDPPQWMQFSASLPVAAGLLLLAAWMFVAKPDRLRLPGVNEFSAGAVVLACAIFLYRDAAATGGDALFRGRNFYGALAVNESRINENTPYLELMHGRITHGNQLKTRAAVRYQPTAYYNRPSGAGRILQAMPRLRSGPIRVGAVGLGVGTLAAYAKMGDVFRFYEINPTVIEIAQGRPHPWFDYIEHARSQGAQVDVVQGDARLSLEKELRDHGSNRYDVILVDAFTGDAIPIHLLTVEAMQVYLRHLAGEDSVIGLHISNRNVDLKTVAAAAADRLGLFATHVTTEAEDDIHLKSEWILLSRSRRPLNVPEVRAAGVPILLSRDLMNPPPAPPAWTDDYSNVWSVLALKGD